MKVIFTNGCFDVFHRGHLELLKYCKEIGDKVIVGLNSDSSVKKLKGDKRPVYCEDDRRALLLELSCVDEVIIFEEETPYLLIKSIKPDIIVKGGDYQVENVVGNDICEVKIFEYVKGYSTTKTIQNIVDR
tara:strand:- start:262 stop:654 length:393 start_codon:yes stop_codon:yes gene_type:complete